LLLAFTLAERTIDGKVVLGSVALVVIAAALSAFFGAKLSATEIAALGFPFAKENTAESAFLNSMVFLGLVLVGTFFMLLIVRAKRAFFLPFVMAFAVFFSFWGILEVFAYAVELPGWLYPIYEPLSLAVAATTAALIIKPVSVLLLDALLLLYGTMAGALFYSVLPPWSVAAIAAVLAVYDLYSVFRGPLRRILEGTVGGGGGQPKATSHLRGAVVYVGDLALGMGDILIYSMLSPLYYLYPSPSVARWALCAVALAAGFSLTLRMLKKKRFVPALPLPVFLSITTYVVYLTLIKP